jgi:hypothetical protein
MSRIEKREAADAAIRAMYSDAPVIVTGGESGRKLRAATRTVGQSFGTAGCLFHGSEIVWEGPVCPFGFTGAAIEAARIAAQSL